MKLERINPETMHANPAFTQMVVIPPGMTTLVVGGQNAVNKQGEVIGKGDLAAQTRQALKNLVACLSAANASVEDLVQVRIYILAGHDLRAGFGAWMEVWGQRTNPPAVTGIFVAGLAHPDFLVEIEATAAIAA
jgi:enamine deaminase RidA (YjgF/YER057c/UK114 family)